MAAVARHPLLRHRVGEFQLLLTFSGSSGFLFTPRWPFLIRYKYTLACELPSARFLST
jgi:hypothetical protein